MMEDIQRQKEALLAEVDALHRRNELAEKMTPDYYNPGMMEYPAQSDGSYDAASGKITIRFEAKGTRYDGRTEQIEKMHVGDEIRVIREKDNAFNPNNFYLLTAKGQNVGNMGASLCNAIAPLYDAQLLRLEGAEASFLEPISKRSRYAKQAVLFVQLTMELLV